MTGAPPIARCPGGYRFTLDADCPREDQPMDYKPGPMYAGGPVVPLWQCPACLTWRSEPDEEGE